MATVYIAADVYLDEVTYAEGDTLSVSYGATLTIRRSTTVKPAKLTALDGHIVIDSFATGAVTPIVIEFVAGAANGVNIPNEASFTVRGGWYYLGIGDGSSGQAFTFYDSRGDIPWVQVETGNATDEWIDCKSLVGASLAAYAGSGPILGSFFNYNKTTRTITFGDGVNGIVVPNGARVRCPDIFITDDGVSRAYNTRTPINTTYIGRWDIDTLLLSHNIYLYLNRTLNAALRNVGLFGYAYVQDCIGATFDKVIAAPDSTSNSVGISFSSNQNLSLIDFQTCSFAEDSCRMSRVFSAQIGTFSGYTLARDSSSDYPLDIDSCDDLNFSVLRAIGGSLNISSTTNVKVALLEHSDTSTGAKTTSYQTYCVNFASAISCDINGLNLIAGGSPAYNYLFNFSGATRDIIVANVNYDCQGHSYGLITGAASDAILARLNLGNVRYSLANLTISSNKIKIMDCLASAVPNTTNMYGRNCKYQGVAVGSYGESWSGSFDVPWMLLYVAAENITEGVIYITQVQDMLGASMELLGEAVHNNISNIYTPNIGDGYILTIPDLIIGVSGFKSELPVWTGTYHENMLIEYSIKEPGGNWGAWKTASAANLSGELLSAATGFYFRVRVTATEAHSTAKITSLKFNVNIDPSVKREYNPLLVDIEISGMAEGSVMAIYKKSDGSAIVNPTTIGASGSYSMTYNYTVDTPIEVVVRKGTSGIKYLPYKAPGLITNTGFALIVNQIEDTVLNG